MNLTAGPVRIALLPLGRLDREDWTHVRARVEVPGFFGDFEAWLQGCDIGRFKRELEAMYATIRGTATLASNEAEILIVLTAQNLGQIGGSYKLQSEYREGGPTLLSGSFEMDQTYLPSLIRSVSELMDRVGDEQNV
jgi:hypothetical protein